MSEDTPTIPPPEGQDEDHSPPELDVREVPGALSSSEQKSDKGDFRDTAEIRANLVRIRRTARSIGRWASNAYVKAQGKESDVKVDVDEEGEGTLTYSFLDKVDNESSPEELSEASKLYMETNTVGERQEWLQEVARREMKEDLARRGREPKKLNEESIEQRMKKHNIPEDILKAAQEQGLSIDYLIHAKTNVVAGERLRKLGIEWGAKPSETPEGYTTLDPGIIVLKQGMKHRARVQMTKEELDRALNTRLGSWRVRGSLKRIGGNIPQPKTLRKLLQRRLAGKVYKNWVKDNERLAERLAKKKKPEIHLYDTGLLGFGKEKKKEILGEIRDLDHDISVVRSKLNPLNSHELKKYEYERNDLAEEIVRIQRKLEALRRGKLEPQDMYRHDKFKRVNKKYNDRTTTAQDPHKYDDFSVIGERAAEPMEVVGAQSPRDSDATSV